MAKKWIIPFVVTLFVLINITTFLFAQGRVKVVEKIVTVYKEVDNKKTASYLNLSVNKEPVNAVNVEALRNSDYHVIDEDYYYADNERIQEAAGSVDTKNEAIDNPAASTESQEIAEQNKASLNFSNLQKETEYISMSGEEQEPSLVDENISIPQLPLFDTDYEVANDGGFENDGLPQLPDIA